MAQLLGSRIVPSFPLSSMISGNQKIDFIKIDVEGAEYLALAGGQILSQHRPIIVSEFSPEQLLVISGVSGEEYLRFLLTFGYEFSIIDAEGPPIAVGADVVTVMAAHNDKGTDHIDILAIPAS